MPESESKRIKWEPRDMRVWEVLSAEDDQLTARLLCTFLEANGIDGRVGTRHGRYTVEVPADQIEVARSLHGQNPTDTSIVNLPPLQEVSTVRSSQSTVRRMRQELVKRGVPEPREQKNSNIAQALMLLAGLIAVLGAVAYLMFWRG